MKRKWQHPEAPKTGREYWRSLGELEDSAEFRGWLEREFPQGAAELDGDDVSRRNFVKLMGAATGLAGFGMAGCSRPVRHLVPYNEHVEWVIPGKALFYASAKPRLGGRGCDPLVVTTFEGRPTKVDGNKRHPMVSGGSDSFTQASVLDLYDPDRSRGFLRGGAASSAEEFENGFLEDFRKAESGEGVAFLISENTSPTRARLLEQVAEKYAGATVYSYDALMADGLKAAEAEIFGEGVVQVPRLTRAEKILSLDGDFLGLDKIGEDPVIEFTRGRKVDGKSSKMNRLYAVEPAFTLTGGMADHRYRLAASQISKVAALIAVEVGKAVGDAGLASAAGSLAKKFNEAVFNADWIRECAADLAASKGKALVVAGSAQPKEVHLLAAAMNAALGAYGGDAPVIPTFRTGTKTLPGISELAKAIQGGKIRTLFVTSEADPVFDAPANLNFRGLLKQVDSVVHLGVRSNLTARAANWHVPGAHYLESWGDWQSVTGVYSVQQPMIEPLFDGRSEIDLLLALLEEPAPEPVAEPAPDEGSAKEGQVADATGSDQAAAPEGEVAVAPVEPVAPPAIPGPEPDEPALSAVKETFESLAGKGADWSLALRNGFADGTKFKRGGEPAVDLGSAAGLKFSDLPYPEKMEVTLTANHQTYDGRYANNGWMQEVPDPITKLTWDNAALVGWKTADELDLENGDLIDVTVGETTVRVPVLRNPGQADYTVHLAVGNYGKVRIDGEKVETGSVSTDVGFNVWPLRSEASPYTVSGAKVEKTGKKYDLAQTSEHHSMEGRAIAREGTLEMHDEAVAHGHSPEDKNWAGRQGMDAHIPENMTLYKGPDYHDVDSPRNDTEFDPIKFPFRIPGESDPFFHPFEVDPDHQWAMTVDLHSCIGCNSCTVACQSENNIPIVGKSEVISGREMHWIRMDRYFSSPNDSLTISQQGTDFENDGRPGRRKVDEDQVEMITQPVACQQCEAAPCETVCPVNATVHTGDGLNAMTYNRCIGTRYCANNCPYKARRFNFFDYNKRDVLAKMKVGPFKTLDLHAGPLADADGRATTTEQLQKNPNVTVRMRGVIEKCTYCVQRISGAKAAAKVAARDSANVQVPAGAITTACQDACPSGAIVFGNLNIKEDRVNKMKRNPRNYDLLRYIGTLPRTSYLARVKNPNPKMPGADRVGKVTAEMH